MSGPYTLTIPQERQIHIIFEFYRTWTLRMHGCAGFPRVGIKPERSPSPQTMENPKFLTKIWVFWGVQLKSCRKLPKVVGATKRIWMPHHVTQVAQQSRSKSIAICGCGIGFFNSKGILALSALTRPKDVAKSITVLSKPFKTFQNLLKPFKTLQTLPKPEIISISSSGSKVKQ